MKAIISARNPRVWRRQLPPAIIGMIEAYCQLGEAPSQIFYFGGFRSQTPITKNLEVVLHDLDTVIQRHTDVVRREIAERIEESGPEGPGCTAARGIWDYLFDDDPGQDDGEVRGTAPAAENAGSLREGLPRHGQAHP